MNEHANNPANSANSANGTASPGPTAGVCPIYHQAIELIGRRWTGAIVQVLAGGALRFGDIAAAIPGLSARMLSERLKELEAEGLVTRTVYAEHPVRIEYCLTAKGQDLDGVMAALGAWAHRWLVAESEEKAAS